MSFTLARRWIDGGVIGGTSISCFIMSKGKYWGSGWSSSFNPAWTPTWSTREEAAAIIPLITKLPDGSKYDAKKWGEIVVVRAPVVRTKVEMRKTIPDGYRIESTLEKDNMHGNGVRRWLSALALGPNSPPQHGWRLVQLATSVSGRSGGGPADVDSILTLLEDMQLITRMKRDLGYAKEICFLGVGGMMGKQLEHAHYPCLFTWDGTVRLSRFFSLHCNSSSDAPFSEILGLWGHDIFKAVSACGARQP